MRKKLFLSLSYILVASLCACSRTEISSSDQTSMVEDSSISQEESSSVEESSIVQDSSNTDTSSPIPDVDSSSSDEVIIDYDFEFPSLGGSAKVKEMSELASYTPTTFAASSYSVNSTELGDGVTLNKCSYTLTSSSSNILVNVVEVDLAKARVVAGSYNNYTNSSYDTASVPTDQATAWEKDNPGKKVMAVTNADFFAWSPCRPVNAFVKDGVILKESHNADASDVPESSPMLFGVCEKGAQIGAMTRSTNKDTNRLAALSYGSCLKIYDKEGNELDSLTGGNTNAGSNSTYTVCNELNKSFYFLEGDVYTIKLIQTSDCKEGEIRACITEKQTITGMKKFKVTEEGVGYFACNAKMNVSYNVGDYLHLVSGFVTSPDGLWDYYDTILGCRHSLVENGNVASTVASETQNGAKARVPHTAVGVKPNGNVVIVSVEDLHYGGKASVCTGLTLVQLADFMRYYGCYDAANFDGGGSSQLCTKNNNGTGSWVVQTISSDTGSSSYNSTRKVCNTIMVVTK